MSPRAEILPIELERVDELSGYDLLAFDEYWAGVAEMHPSTWQAAAENQKEVEELGRQLFGETPLLATDVTLTRTWVWYIRQGARNTMRGAESKLEQAFAIAIQASTFQHEEEPRQINRELDPYQVVEICGLEGHRTHDLLVGTQLLQERLWLEPPGENHRRLSELLLYMYGKIGEDATLAERKERVLRHQYDIAFGLVHADLRMLEEAGLQDSEAWRVEQDHFVNLQKAYAWDLLRIIDTEPLSNGWALDEPLNNGWIWEWLYPLIYRAHLAANGTLTRAEIWNGLKRTDEPHLDGFRGDKETPFQSSDQIIVTHTPAGQHHEFVQCVAKRKYSNYEEGTLWVKPWHLIELTNPKNTPGSNQGEVLRAKLRAATVYVLDSYETGEALPALPDRIPTTQKLSGFALAAA